MARTLKDSIGEIKNVQLVVGDEILTDRVEFKHFTDECLLLTTSISDVYVADGMSVNIAMYCSNGVFVFKTDILGLEENFPYLFWYLKIPENFDVRQQRESYRTRFNMNATLTVIFNNGEKLISECTTHDLSGNGVGMFVTNDTVADLLSKNTIDMYAKIGVCLHFEGRDVHAKADFVHKRAIKGLAKSVIYAFKFTRINPTDSEYITKQCFSKQLLEQNKSKREF